MKSLRHLKIAKGVTRLPASEVRDLMRGAAAKPNKYKAKAIEADGYFFASTREHDHYQQLKLLERAGEITDLELQPRFALVVNGIKVGEYRADFQYFDLKGEKRIVDAKGVRTAVYRLKAKLVKALYGITIEEV